MDDANAGGLFGRRNGGKHWWNEEEGEEVERRTIEIAMLTIGLIENIAWHKLLRCRRVGRIGVVFPNNEPVAST